MGTTPIRPPAIRARQRSRIVAVVPGVAEARRGSVEEVVITARSVWEPHALGDHHRPEIGGGQVHLADLRGRDVVLVFYCYDWGSI